ncbi:bacteriophage CI repressor [Parashewanella curva]|uniref:Bacteriophage CI repressor n=1 Tax=Parashewanella curva TaxID=2338552 RepID=A0A3L8PR75_9GAMM|nr:helix-turn-helix transcriptional regulator [Parashewanella curva]RLV57891.1 bacteriophage CI repressor [Parashewanella curva]
MSNLVKLKNAKFEHPLNSAVQADGGKDIVERLIRLFGVRNRLELAEALGTHPGTFSTWQTRNTTPYEMLVRINLATGVPLDYLCFGYGKGVPDIFKNTQFASNDNTQKSQENEGRTNLSSLAVFVIENGELIKVEAFPVDTQFHKRVGITDDGYAIEQAGNLLFINTNELVITKGQYLYSVNGAHQIGELKQLADGNTYCYDDGEKYLLNRETTKVIGKVASVLGKN